MEVDRSVQRVVVTDIDMPLGSMVRFIFKWSVAAIPAAILLSVVGAIVWLSVAGLVALITGR